MFRKLWFKEFAGSPLWGWLVLVLLIAVFGGGLIAFVAVVVLGLVSPYIFLRLLLGLPLLAILGFIWFFVFNLLTAIVNVVALGAAKGTRALLRIRGTHGTIGRLGLSGAEIGKSLSLAVFWFSVFWYAFLFPIGAGIAEGSMAIAFGIAFLVWTPAVFVSSLAISIEDV